MVLLSLLACILLGALSAQGEVLRTFNKCSKFFYRDREPRGMDQYAKKICQKYNGIYHYATLYSTHRRIPVYSAYTFSSAKLQRGWQFERPCKGFFEPQLENINEDRDEYRNEMKQESPTDIIQKQAVNSDYTTTGYDRGHLSPSSFQSPDNRLPTFTLTNAAPLDPCFNRVHWYKWESALKKILKEELGAHPNGIAYIVTGTVPHPNYRIPQKQPDDEEDIYRDEMVTVPTHVWTAVCFTDFSDKDKPYSFSFGYIGVNSPDGTIMVRSVSDLNSDLTELYRRALGQQQAVSIFADDCNKGGQKLNLTERIKSRVRLTSKIQMPDEVRKYFQMPEKSIPAPEDSTHCQDDELYYIMESGFKPCCTTPCLFQKQLMSYWCSSGQKQIQCSPEYPTITANGETCKDDHPCDTHGLDYYWCYKKSGSWDYCSPLPRQSKAKNDQNCRPNHVCGKYGKNYNWCYTDDNNNWSECCTNDDCSTAINSKTCRADHQCGYHGKDYLWCYTTDGSWDYCCTQC